MSNGSTPIEITQNTLLKLLIRRGSDGERKNITLSEGELGYTVDTSRLFVGDGATVGGIPTSFKLYSGSGSPTQFTGALVNDLAYDSISGSIFILTASDNTDINNWELFAGPAANRVDNTTLQINTSTGVLSVKSISAAQIDNQVAGTGLEFNGISIQTKADQVLNSINPRSGSALQLSDKLTFGTAGGRSEFTLPAYDGAANTVLTTDGAGYLTFQPAGAVSRMLILSGNQIPVGSIVQFGSGGDFGPASTDIPYGYMVCDGTTKYVSAYPSLFSAISSYYGGDGVNTFAVPSVTANNYAYIIKYLEDVILQQTTINVDSTLSAFDISNNQTVTSLIIPTTGAEFSISVVDYVSLTEVAALCATLYDEISQDSRYIRRNIIPTLNTAVMQYGYRHSFIFDASNTLRCAGNSDATGSAIGVGESNIDYPFFFPTLISLSTTETPISAISVGNSSIILTNLGRVFTCGSNTGGILGAGSSSTKLSSFTAIDPTHFNDEPVISIAASYANNNDTTSETAIYAITNGGNLYGWGSNAAGQLGLGSLTPSSTARPVKLNTIRSAGSTYSSISASYISSVVTSGRAGGQYVFVIDTNNKVHSCGDNTSGQLGIGNTTQQTVFVDTGKTADQIFLGGYVTTNSNSYLLSGGALWACGDNANKQIGDNTTTDRTSFVPVLGIGGAGQLSDVQSLTLNITTATGASVCAHHTDSTISVWGDGASYRLGTGSVTDVGFPTRPSLYTGINKAQFHYNTLFVLTSAGEIYSVGDNSDGTAGDGTLYTPKTSFVRAFIPQHTRFKDFFTVGDGTDKSVFAISDSRYKPELYGWGRNTNGQLGFNKTVTPVLVPIKVQL